MLSDTNMNSVDPLSNPDDRTVDVPSTLQSATEGTPALSIGERIEVLWTIERDPDDAGPQTEERWWGASVRAHGAGSDHYTLLYDEYMEFPPAEVRVCISGLRSLRDEDSGGEVMRWRKEGDVTADSGDEGERTDDRVETQDAGDRREPGGDVYSMRDVVRAQEEVDAEQGESAGDAMLAALGSLPVMHQTEMAIKYRQFADELKSELANLMRQRGPGCIITEGDIHALFEKIRGCGPDGSKL